MGSTDQAVATMNALDPYSKQKY